MKPNKNLKRVMISIILVVLIFGGLCAFFYNIFIYGAIHHDPIENAIYLSKRLLNYASIYPTGKMPQNDIPSNLWVQEDCWELLQRELKENGKYPQVTAYKNGIDFRDVDDIISQIDFSNGQRILIGYYEGGLTWCQNTKTK